jgi:hypothetical protein
MISLLGQVLNYQWMLQDNHTNSNKNVVSYQPKPLTSYANNWSDPKVFLKSELTDEEISEIWGNLPQTTNEEQDAIVFAKAVLKRKNQLIK